MFWILMIIPLLYLALQIMIVIQLNVIMNKIEDMERRVKGKDANR